MYGLRDRRDLIGPLLHNSNYPASKTCLKPAIRLWRNFSIWSLFAAVS